MSKFNAKQLNERLRNSVTESETLVEYDQMEQAVRKIIKNLGECENLMNVVLGALSRTVAASEYDEWKDEQKRMRTMRENMHNLLGVARW